MRRYKGLITCSFIFLLFQIVNGQTTTINFTTTPYINAGNNTWDPHYWDNTGCPMTFGPSPTPLNGHNLRVLGATFMYTLLPGASFHIATYGDTRTGQRSNTLISIEYPFKSNKTYLIEIIGINDHYWTGQPLASDHYNGVFWVKLDNTPELFTGATNKCKEWLHPVDRSVGRYSKLIADPNRVIRDVNYSVKFSPLENKNALKIIFDPYPIDPAVIIDNEMALRWVKITEMPYEEESGRYHSTYSNVPAPPRGTPGYDIPVILDNPTSQPGRILTSISVNPNQWGLNTSSTGYSLNLSQLIQNLKGTNLVNISLMTGRPTRGGDGSLNLPCTSLDNNYSFNMTSNNDVIINVTNPTNTAPNAVINFNITYNNP